MNDSPFYIGDGPLLVAVICAAILIGIGIGLAWSIPKRREP